AKFLAIRSCRFNQSFLNQSFHNILVGANEIFQNYILNLYIPCGIIGFKVPPHRAARVNCQSNFRQDKAVKRCVNGQIPFSRKCAFYRAKRVENCMTL
ncbi:MAG: hypothetical protein LUD69_03415, partial [Oscillospiraceae bacterium]|nr:hypothetical protein [Oscillospiraceae bacterium]